MIHQPCDFYFCKAVHPACKAIGPHTVFSLADELLTSESTYYGQTSACGCETVDRVPVAQLRVTDANQTLNGKIFPGYSVTVDGHVRDRVRQGRSVNRNEEGQREAEQKQGQSPVS